MALASRLLVVREKWWLRSCGGDSSAGAMAAVLLSLNVGVLLVERSRLKVRQKTSGAIGDRQLQAEERSSMRWKNDKAASKLAGNPSIRVDSERDTR